MPGEANLGHHNAGSPNTNSDAAGGPTACAVAGIPPLPRHTKGNVGWASARVGVRRCNGDARVSCRLLDQFGHFVRLVVYSAYAALNGF